MKLSLSFFFSWGGYLCVLINSYVLVLSIADAFMWNKNNEGIMDSANMLLLGLILIGMGSIMDRLPKKAEK